MAALAGEDVPIARVNPRQVRHFAKGIGRLAKTDPIDARVLATFGERARPRVTRSRRSWASASSSGCASRSLSGSWPVSSRRVRT